MRVRAWRRLLLVACCTGLLALGAVACDSGAKEVIVRPKGNEFVVVGTIGDKTDFVLLNDSDRNFEAQVIALNGHSETELKDALSSGGGLPDWATSVGVIPAEAGKAGQPVEVDTDEDGYAIVELTGSEPIVGALSRTAAEEAAPAGGTAAAGGTAEAGGALPPLPAAGPVGSASATVDVSLKEFSVTAQPSSTASGQIAFSAQNDGVVLHELVVIRTEVDAGALPQKSGIVDEANPALEVKGKAQNIAGGASGQITATGLPAGKYALICNVPGHYQAGMHTAFTVQ